MRWIDLENMGSKSPEKFMAGAKSQEVMKQPEYQLRKEHMTGRSPGQTPGEDGSVAE